MHKIFTKPTGSIHQLIRSMITSMLGFAVDFGLLALFVEGARAPYIPAAAVSFIAGTSVVYVLSVAWVFPQRRFESRRIEYLLFLLTGSVGLALNVLLMGALTELAGLHYLLSKLGSGLIVFLFNFAARKFVLFSASMPNPGKRSVDTL